MSPMRSSVIRNFTKCAPRRRSRSRTCGIRSTRPSYVIAEASLPTSRSSMDSDRSLTPSLLSPRPAATSTKAWCNFTRHLVGAGSRLSEICKISPRSFAQLMPSERRGPLASFDWLLQVMNAEGWCCMRLRSRISPSWERVFPLVCCMVLSGCHAHQGNTVPAIQFTKIPPAAQGGRERVDSIAGRVIDARPGQQIVIYAHSGPWWVQPWPDRPFIPIQKDSTWSTETHLGFEYAALLVEPTYRSEERRV